MDRHRKHENEILKTKVASLQTLVDDMTGSHISLRKQLRKKEKQLEEIIKAQQKPTPSPPQVHAWLILQVFESIFLSNFSLLQWDLQDILCGEDDGPLFHSPFFKY